MAPRIADIPTTNAQHFLLSAQLNTGAWKLTVTSPFSHIVWLPAVSMRANDIWGLGVSAPARTGVHTRVKGFHPNCCLSRDEPLQTPLLGRKRATSPLTQEPTPATSTNAAACKHTDAPPPPPPPPRSRLPSTPSATSSAPAGMWLAGTPGDGTERARARERRKTGRFFTANGACGAAGERPESAGEKLGFYT